MKAFKTIYGWERKENRTDARYLKMLEMRIVEVKIRKFCRCSVCNRNINVGEFVLKTTQRTDRIRSGYYYQNYCSDCYTVLTEEVPDTPIKEPQI